MRPICIQLRIFIHGIYPYQTVLVIQHFRVYRRVSIKVDCLLLKPKTILSLFVMHLAFFF
jgi:hypothetical protein